jgi:hypothetical protein
MFMLFNNTVNTLAQESWLTFACKTLIRIETEATQREKWLVARVGNHAGTPEFLTSVIIAA